MNRPLVILMFLAASFFGCTRPVAMKPAPIVEKPPVPEAAPPKESPPISKKVEIFLPDSDIADVAGIPQRLDDLARAAKERLSIESSCREALYREFLSRYFAPWTASHLLYDRGETIQFMKELGGRDWYTGNLRRLESRLLQEILDSCALESFPSRFDLGIAVSPGHLRGLPTQLPFFEKKDGYPFDMLEYPQLKLNEPLRVLHATRDGDWLFVETPYTNGWIPAREVALVDRELVESWMRLPLVVLVRDRVPVSELTGGGAILGKLGTLFPLTQQREDGFDVLVATAGEGGLARSAAVRLPKADAAAYPVEFNAENVTLVGNALLGQPYGWGEMYGLRDCSALLRDFFIPFGIWLPRTSADQIASVPRVLRLSGRTPQEKKELIIGEGRPFLSLLHKKGHVLLYLGTDAEGRPLVLHDAWSVAVKNGNKERDQIVGKVVVTTLEPGRELGLYEGRSLIERITELGTITSRCRTKGAKK